MNFDAEQKVTADHLKRNAYLYIRQSTLRQVAEHKESTERQYALRQRALALGWSAQQIIVIDSDLGQSGASAADRQGFQKLVAEVGMGLAGIVLGLEVSRLARNSSDWHRLLEICALTGSLILDEDGLYDPTQFNDRLLLGLKGTMSEAELHVMRARMRGGLLNKAKSGELRLMLPIGFAYDDQDRVVLHPDQRVQRAIRLFFQTFQRTGAASAVIRAFRREGIRFPRRILGQPGGEIVWDWLELGQALRILKNPRYAGAFFFGRTRVRKKVGGGVLIAQMPQDQWYALLRATHPGYISWEQFEKNQKILRENAQAHGVDRRSTPREGPALLQGLVICAVCGFRMAVHYHRYAKRIVPEYLCQQRNVVRSAEGSCQAIHGGELDRTIGNLLVETVTPLALEVAISVQEELQSRAEEADRLRAAHVERARYEAQLARRRYMQVDPDNRLVADSLETDWNLKMKDLAEAEQEYKRQRQTDQLLDAEQRSRILALATDFPKLWNDSKTPQRERKRMVRLLIEDITVKKSDKITAFVRFKGGATKMLALPIPIAGFPPTSADVIAAIDNLLEQHNYLEIAEILNQRGFRTAYGLPFDSVSLSRICRTYKLKSRYDRLRKRGLLTLDEISKKLGVHEGTVRIWQQHGILRAYPVTDRNQCLYEDPGADPPKKNRGVKLTARQKVADVMPKEVQYES
jgi:DNA invertase Pin-like site-specific DNA recombinase